jgi:hypothetical protein
VKLTTHLHLVPRPKNERSYTSTPQYEFTAWCLVKHRDNFTFRGKFTFTFYLFAQGLVHSQACPFGISGQGGSGVSPPSASVFTYQSTLHHYFNIPNICIFIYLSIIRLFTYSVKKDEMGGESSMRWRDKKSTKNFGRKS